MTAGQLRVERLQQRNDLQRGHGAAQHPVQEVARQLQGELWQRTFLLA